MDTSNLIYIGQKPLMQYVLVATNRLNNGDSNVVIRARGRLISKAVDVALIVKDRFIDNTKIQKIEISTEVLPGKDGRPLNVSSIEISLQKG